VGRQGFEDRPILNASHSHKDGALTRIDGALLILGLMVIVLALAAQGGRFSGPLDVLTHFAPLWLLGAMLVGLGGLLFVGSEWRWIVAGIGLAGVIASSALIIPEFTRTIRPSVSGIGSHQIKLIQFNAWDLNREANTTADWLAAQMPDIIVVEEVQPPIRQAIIKRGYHYTPGFVDTAIFSRSMREPFQVQVPASDWFRLPGFARASFSAPSGSFGVIGVHLTWPTRPDQWSQVLAIEDLINRFDRRRLIVVGDFNLTPWSFRLREIDRQFSLERRDRAIPSWPARLDIAGRAWRSPAVLPIDHVYAGSDWRTVNIERGPRLGSDHYPLVVTLSLDEEPQGS
jgi:endonuclease/exonuclease/phosphatase (EEP) superfamily protein YafD